MSKKLDSQKKLDFKTHNFTTVTGMADLFGVTDETIRRWIRENIDKERRLAGMGRNGIKLNIHDCVNYAYSSSDESKTKDRVEQLEKLLKSQNISYKKTDKPSQNIAEYALKAMGLIKQSEWITITDSRYPLDEIQEFPYTDDMYDEIKDSIKEILKILLKERKKLDKLTKEKEEIEDNIKNTQKKIETFERALDAIVSPYKSNDSSN